MGDPQQARHEDICHTFLLGRARRAPWKPQAAKTLPRVHRIGQSTAVMTPTLPGTRTPGPCPGLRPTSPPRPALSVLWALCLCPCAGGRAAVPGHTAGSPRGQRGAHGRGCARGPRPGVGPAPALPHKPWLRSAAPPGKGRKARPPPPGPDGHLRWARVPPGALPAAGTDPGPPPTGVPAGRGAASRSVSEG